MLHSTFWRSTANKLRGGGGSDQVSMDRETQTAIRNRLKPPPSASIAQRVTLLTHTHTHRVKAVYTSEKSLAQRGCVCVGFL